MPRFASPAGLAVSLGLALAACQPSVTAPVTTRPAPPPSFLITDLVGGWRWQLRTSDAGTTRIETETWRLRPAPGAPAQLVGRYLREVEVRSDDLVPFACNQRPWYRQRALFDVTVERTATGVTVHETGFRSEPSPCDHAFRHLGSYTGTPGGERLTLSWEGGHQTLWQVDGELAELPDAPWPSEPALAGPWRWDATSYNDAGNLRDEHEWWEVTQHGDDQLDITYRRRVTVRSPDDSIIACAGASSWSFDDAYVVTADREDARWHLHEVAADPGEHPCLQATPRRSLDEAMAEQIGDFLVLEWRGKRRQVLFRPD